MVRSLLDGQGQQIAKCPETSCLKCSDILKIKNINVNPDTSSGPRGHDHFEQMLQQNLGDLSFCMENQPERHMRVLANNSIMGKSNLGLGATYKKLRVSKLEGCVDGPQKSLLNRYNQILYPIY